MKDPTRKPSESEIQQAFIRLMALELPEESRLLFSIPNGAMLGGRNKYALLNKLKAEGFKNGIPDMFLARTTITVCTHGDDYYETCGLWLEFKAKNGVVSEAQDEWHHRLRLQGYAVAVVRSAEEALNKVKRYLKGEL